MRTLYTNGDELFLVKVRASKEEKIEFMRGDLSKRKKTKRQGVMMKDVTVVK